MTRHGDWDYLVVTASNDAQAAAYGAQIHLRHSLGLLPQVRRALVSADPGGQRIGSGGATLLAIAKILEIEREQGEASPELALRKLRILIVHAGGDSMRLPAYGPCGKIFLPLPGAGDSPVPLTLFDRLVPAFLELPEGAPGRGQIVVAAGDALMDWDVTGLDLARAGITLLGCRATPEEASRHGVLCLGEDSSIVRYLQKPTIAEQKRAGAIGPSGQAVLDVAVLSMDASAAAVLLDVLYRGGEGTVSEWIAHGGLDLYREVCCALGTSATMEHYLSSTRAGGSIWPEAKLAGLYPGLRRLPSHAHVLPYCRFLHFGSSRQLAPSGLAFMELCHGSRPAGSTVLVNNVISEVGCVTGPGSWVEGCRISAPLALSGENVVVGLDIDQPLSLPAEACLDVVDGRDRHGREVQFTRIYGVRDTFKDSVNNGGTFCGRPILDWMAAAGADPNEVWLDTPDPSQRTLWRARVFPAGVSRETFRRWLWMWDPAKATAEEKRAYVAADRYSAAEIALLTDQRAFSWRRLKNWASQPRGVASERAAAIRSSWVARVLAAAEASL
ncbi:MAG TPA: L-fucokinase, partial [Bryobacteraceae bacterium]|nr:L-fucokinase [Bryobacteraceae bacterium]